MKYKSNKLKINKDLYKRKQFIKFEIKKIILKSIIQNKNIKPIIRANAIYKLSKINNYFSISKQKNNICLKTGRIKGVLKITQTSRHYLKKLLINNNLQNIKINSW